MMLVLYLFQIPSLLSQSLTFLTLCIHRSTRLTPTSVTYDQSTAVTSLNIPKYKITESESTTVTLMQRILTYRFLSRLMRQS